MKKKKWIGMAFILLAGLVSVTLSGMRADAAGKVKLSTKKLTITAGKKKVLKLKNNKKKVKWTVVSGKNKIKLSKKKKTSVTIQGKKAGKAKIQAKVGKKKYVCKVTVKAAPKKKTNNKTGENKTQDTEKEYTISGYVYSKSGELVKSSLLTITYGQGSYEQGYTSYSAKVDAKTGKYSIRVKPGVYNIVNYSTESEKTEGVRAGDHELTLPPVTVQNKDVVQNLTLQDECIQAKLLKGDGSPITDGIFVYYTSKNKEISLSGTGTSLYPDKNGNILWIRDNSFFEKYFKEYLSDIYYTISVDGYLLKEVPCMQKDIFGATWKYNIFKVEGYITNRGNDSPEAFDADITPHNFNIDSDSEEENYSRLRLTISNIIKFYFYAQPGTYYMQRGDTRAVGNISVGNKNIKNCHVNFNTYNIDIDYEHDGSSGYDDLDNDRVYAYKEGKEYRLDPYSSYECWLEPGTYELKMRNMEDYNLVTVGKITVTNSDQSVVIRY